MKNFTLALILFSINATLSGQCDVSNCVKVIIGLGANGQGQLTPELAVTNNIDTCDVVVQILDEDGAVAVPFMESINLDCDDLSFALTYVIMDTLSGLSCSGLLQIIDPFDACPPMPDCNNLLCNAQINVSLDPNGLAVLQPEYFTEGDSDYCETSIMLLDAIGNAVTPLSDSLIIDCNFLGAYSFEIHDTLNDNICWGTLVVQDQLNSCLSLCDTIICQKILVSLDDVGNAILTSETAGFMEDCATVYQVFNDQGEALTEASDTLLIDCELVGLSTYTVTDTLSDASCSDILQVLDPFNLCTSSTSDLVDMTSYYRNGFLHLEGLPESTKEICISNISGQVLINTDKVDVIDLNSLSNNQIYVVTLLTEDRVRSWKLFVP